MGRQLLEIFRTKRLSAGSAQLEDAESARLGEDPLPVLGRQLAFRPEPYQADWSGGGQCSGQPMCRSASNVVGRSDVTDQLPSAN